jgi:hypothetical protein
MLLNDLSVSILDYKTAFFVTLVTIAIQNYVYSSCMYHLHHQWISFLDKIKQLLRGYSVVFQSFPVFFEFLFKPH